MTQQSNDSVNALTRRTVAFDVPSLGSYRVDTTGGATINSVTFDFTP